MSVLKLLFNIFIIYAIFQIVKMYLSVRNVQKQFQNDLSDLNSKVRQNQPKKQENKPNLEGDYVDYEEVK
jgi:predicted Holliday junction resolvase-like endonuclease